MDKKIDWYKRAVVYQIYPLSFMDSNGDGIGDLQGIISKLDYIKDLGIDVIWLSPVYESPMQDNGYDISNYQAINPMFGSMLDMIELIRMTHQKGMRIIMDLVINHTSNQHEWFKKAVNESHSLYRDYYIWSDKPTNVDSIFGGSAWTYDPITKQYYFHLFAEQQPDLNWHNPQLRQEIYTMINDWLDLGIDGFRLDVIDLIGKDVYRQQFADGPYLDQYLKELYETCFQGKDIMTVGETPGISIKRASEITDANDPKLNMVFQFSHIGLDEMPGQGKWAIKPVNLVEMKDVFINAQKTFHQQGWQALFLSNHDQPRVVSRYGNIAYRQESAKMLATLIYGMQGTPFIYQGEEIGMTGVDYPIADYQDIETLQIFDILTAKGWSATKIMEAIHKKSRDNSRTPLQWDDTHQAGFSTGRPWLKVNPNYHTVNVKTDIENPHGVYQYYQKLLKLRKQNDTFLLGTFDIYQKDNKQVFSYFRKYRNQQFLIVCSWADSTIEFELPTTKYHLLLSNYETVKTYHHTMVCPPYFACVMRIED